MSDSPVDVYFCDEVRDVQRLHEDILTDRTRQLPILIDAGADVNATAQMYGGGSTTIALLISSSFSAEAGVMDDVVKVLADAGAETDGS
jgi:hypothetical protein